MKEQLLRLLCLKQFNVIVILLCTFSINGQKTLVVLDESGEVLIGVECFNEDYSFAKISDIDGRILIPKPYENEILNLKYLGFKIFALDLATVPETEFTVNLSPEQRILEEIILVGRSDIRQRDFLQKIDAIKSKEIAATNPQTTADALSRFADVYIQKSQMGGGSPIIRGFEANKVLLVVDGVRMNNAIYRNGHLQNAITVDNAILDQMEVIYGPSSLMYGSDALGGVVHFRTKDPVLNLSEYKKTNIFGNYYLRYGTANQEKSAHFDINIGKKKWASLTSISYSDFGDLRMGSRRTTNYPDFGKRFTYQERINNEDVITPNENVNIQKETGYRQIDLLQKMRYQINDRMNITANVQLSTSSNIPRYDQLILEANDQLEFAEWSYGPQDRFLGSLKFQWKEEKPWMDEIMLIASRQDIEESRISRGFGSDWRENRIENVGVNALTLDVKKKIDGRRKHTLYYGADLNLNEVSSTAFRENIRTTEKASDIFTRYPSGRSNMQLWGTYFQYINESPDSTFVFHGGLRYNYFSTFVSYDESDPINWPAIFYDGISANNGSLNWSGGMNWQPTKDWTIRILASSAFRAPNVDDIGKLRVKNDDATVPNPDLGPEKSINGEINLSKSFSNRVIISFTGFYTRLTDAIIRTNYQLPDGSTSFVDGDKTYNVEANINAESAEVKGLSGNIKIPVNNNLFLSSSINYIKGIVLDEEKSPLSHIPPLYGRTQLTYSVKNWDFRFLALYNGKKLLEQFGGSIDNPEYATPEGALGWSIYNVYGNYQHKSITFQFGLENILDKHYTPFASGVSGSGINATLGVRGKF